MEVRSLTTSVKPQNTQAERAVLGSMLIDDSVVVPVMSVLSSDDFYDYGYRTIFESMESLVKQKRAVDTVTVADELGNKILTVGGSTVLGDLVRDTPTSANWESYAALIEEAAVNRRLIEAAGKIAEIGYQGLSSDEALDKAQAEMYRLARTRTNSTFLDLSHVIGLSWDHYDRAKSGENDTIKSGIIPMDKLIGGWGKSDLVIVAARPSVGKTALAVNLATNAAVRQGKSVAIFSLEMSSEQIGTRILADAAHVDISKIRAGTLTQAEEEKLTVASDAIARAKIYVDDSSALTPLEIRSRCRRLKQEQGLDMVVIDYIQLLSAIRQQKDANRVMETSEISRSLKQIARELNVPVIALSQLSRNSEYRDSGEPRLADLRDSGSIEQDADVVIMLWRPKEQGDEFYDNVNVKVAKHRNGPIGDLQLVFRKATTSFTSGEQ